MTEPAQKDASTAFRTMMIHLAAFSYAAGFFISTKKFLDFAPTDPVAVGRVTVDGVSKFQDYVRFGFFFLFVPLATIGLIHWLPRIGRRLTRSIDAHVPLGVVALASLPLVLSPILYLTTYKELWSILLPPVLSWMIVHGWVVYVRSPGLRELVRSGHRGTHALVVVEGVALLLFRYLATGRRIAHVPSILLETIFVLVFLALWWSVFCGLAILLGKRTTHDLDVTLDRIAGGAFPLVLLTLAPLLSIGPVLSMAVAILLTVAGVALSLLVPISPPAPRLIDRFVAWIAAPLILFVVGYSSAAHTTGWIDLFHLGETIGPASDYLRGKLPYVGVLPLHGLLQNGLLDMWLMQIFGRSVDVAVARSVFVEALMIPAIWILSWTAFRSWLASSGAVIGAFILAADNQRAVLTIIVVILIVSAIRSRRRWPVAIAGAVSSVALFFSLEMGLYCLIAAPVAYAGLWLIDRTRAAGRESLVAIAWFLAGTVLGAAPFLLWLGSNGLAGSFFTTSFVMIPGLIDATWSLPFPDLDDWFSKRMTAESLFQLAWHIRFVINPLILVVAIVTLGYRAVRRIVTPDDRILLVLVVFAVISQRSALGRADFYHQWFAAFLISPVLVALLWRAITAVRAQPRVVRSAAVLTSIALTPVLLTLLWAPSLLERRLESTVEFRARRSGTAPDPAGEMSTRRIERVVAAIQERSASDEHIYDFSNQPALYFLADRPNPTRFYQVPMISPLELQREVVRDLERAQPSVIVMSSPDSFDRFDGVLNRDRAPLVASWIEHHYSPDVMVEGIDLWVPDEEDRGTWTPPDPIPGPGAVALRPQPAGRMVLPSIGSVTGGGEARWSSDFYIHNPHDVPVAYRLRYVTATSIQEQSFPVPPHAGRRIDDIAASLFGTTQRLGALWVVYDQTYPPLVRADHRRDPGSGRGGQAMPLTPDDAAGGEDAPKALFITGFERHRGERINLSLVNFGPGTATATLTLVDREGNARGGTYHATIEEEHSVMIIDLVTALGAEPEPAGGIRVDVASGVVAAQLSIVDPSTGSASVLSAVPID